MYIKELELENFKSFKHQKFLFNKGITCVAGPNGSGKSNVFDAVIFVLGNNSSNRLRYKTISDLICKDGKNEFANVKLVFDDNTIVERTITSDSSVFRINGKRTTQEAILGFLKECKLSPDGHNLIQQGNNKRIVDMNLNERKVMIEDLAGVARLDEQKQRSEKNIDFAKNKLNSAKAVLEERKAVMENLEKEKTVAEEYLKIKEQEVLTKAILLKREKQVFENEIEKMKKKITGIKEQNPEKQKELEHLKKEIKTKDYELLEFTNRNRLGFEKLNSVSSELAILKYKLDSAENEKQKLSEKDKNETERLESLKGEIDLLESDIKTKEKQKKIIEHELKELEKTKSSFDFSEVEIKQKSAKEKENELVLQIREKSQQLLKYNTELSKVQDNLNDLHNKQRELVQVTEEIKKEKQKFYNLEGLEEALHNSSLREKKQENEIEKIESNLEKLNTKKVELQNKIKINENEINVIKNVVGIDSELISVEDEKEAEKILQKNIAQNKFGTFFFVLEKHKLQADSLVIVKTAKPDAKIKSLENENADLEKKLETIDNDIEETEMTLKELIKEGEACSFEIKNIAEKIKKTEQLNAQVSSKIDFLLAKKQDLEEQVSLLGSKHNNTKEIEKEIAELEKEIKEFESKKFSASNFGNVSKVLGAFEDYNKKYAELQSVLFEIKELEQKKQFAENEESVSNETLTSCENGILQINKVLSEYLKKQKELTEQEQKEKTALSKFESEKQTMENEIKQKEVKILQLESDLKFFDRDLDELQKNLFLKEEDLAKKVDEIKKYIELNTNNLNLENIAKEFEKFAKTNVKDLQNNYFELAGKLNDFGNVNLKAIEDYAEYKEKYGTVLERVAQLEMELEELKNKIKDLMFEKEQKFLQYLEKLNTNFKEITNMLGLEELGLLHIRQDEKDERSEIIGVAMTCKNKKKSTLALSGGEKALVTIAFLFSVLKFEPAPFYLLDEIDADLDYKNSEKVFNMLSELSKDTQMIMISHNPVIINSCENVIGISKNKSGLTAVFVKNGVIPQSV